MIDSFLEEAIEVDVDCIGDGRRVVVAGVMEHIEEAGVHSGDSACCLPPFSLPEETIDEIKSASVAMAEHLNVVGLMNVQFAVKNENDQLVVYVLEVNPRASRTVPFVAKSTGMQVAKIAAKVMAGVSLDEQGISDMVWPEAYSVKESVFPFRKFAGVDIVLGPEMRSTGEVMGVSSQFPIAFAKSQLAAGIILPESGRVFVSVSSAHKSRAAKVAGRLHEMGYEIIATEGTAKALEAENIPVEHVKKIIEGHPNLIDHMKNNAVDLILNTPSGKGARTDEGQIRAAAVQHGVPCITTIQAAEAAVSAIEALRSGEMQVQSLQERFADQKLVTS